MGGEAEMEEPVRVAHGRYGCKSAYETYKRFARTNTRPGVRPRRRGGREPVREKEREGKAAEKREGRKGELSPRWIQMRINIYKRVRRWSSLLDSSRAGMRTLRGNIGSRAASRNERYKGRERESMAEEEEQGNGEKEERAGKEVERSKDASGIFATKSAPTDSTGPEFRERRTLYLSVFIF